MNTSHGMTMRQPATRWQDALPIGNGQVGAMMYGRICSEQILLNHEAIWYDKDVPTLVDISDRLAELRGLIDSKRYGEAVSFLDKQNTARGGHWTRTCPYQPACDIRILAKTAGAFRRYRRGIDFASAAAWTQWEDDRGTIRRDLFVSRVDDVVVLRIRRDDLAPVSCRLRLEPHDEGKDFSVGGWGGALGPSPCEFAQSVDGTWSQFVGTFDTGKQFGGVARVVAVGGEVADADGHIAIDGADEILVLTKLFANQPADAALARCRAELAALSPDFDALLARHAEVHRELFERMTLSLPGAATEASTEELLLAAYDGDVPVALVRTMFEYGRHLLICSGRAGGWPANLQGVWNGDYVPAWSADYHSDENVQMNYWQALPGNLPEVALPVFDYYERYMADYRANARTIYGCRGILLPIAQSTDGSPYPGPWMLWTGAAGWIGQLYYDYYLFTGDREFLADRAIPWLKETAAFYEDFTFDGPDGKLMFSPSMSPENTPSIEGGSLATINATMDVAICREVLANLCEACELLGADPEGVARWRAMLAKLPAYEVNEDGAMREWLHPAFPDNYHHRHQSHIYPVFPGFSVTAETEPAIYDASRVAVEKRLVIGLTSQTGWSMAHMANIYARLGDGDRALECIELLTRSSTGPNLLTYHNDWRAMGLTFGGWQQNPPFQIDANFGLTAAVLEMLVFSAPGMIKLLPALPTCWPTGAAEGIACRGGAVVDMQWDLPAGRLTATLRSGSAQQIVVKFPAEPSEVLCEAVPAPASPRGPAYRQITLPAGRQPITLDVTF